MINKEIGGYLEIERNYGKEFYSSIALNTSRNCLQLLVREKKIKRLYLPYYLCLVIEETCISENIEIIYYHINNSFEPILDSVVLKENDYIYIVNYFGMLSCKYIKALKDKYKNIILDNTHSFYISPLAGVDTIYNCRKYFGVPDGAYLISDLDINNIDKQYEEADSLSRIKHLFGRFQKDAESFYEDFFYSECELDNNDIMLMSKITHNMLCSIDYDRVYNSRVENYDILAKKLKDINLLKINKIGTYMYPLLVNNGKKLREYLINNKIYVPKLWPNLDKFELNDFESSLFENLIPLPIDQRYSESDMNIILKTIKEFLELESEM